MSHICCFYRAEEWENLSDFPEIYTYSSECGSQNIDSVRNRRCEIYRYGGRCTSMADMVPPVFDAPLFQAVGWRSGKGKDSPHNNAKESANRRKRRDAKL